MPSWPPKTYSESPWTTADGKTREPGEREKNWTGAQELPETGSGSGEEDEPPSLVDEVMASDLGVPGATMASDMFEFAGSCRIPRLLLGVHITGSYVPLLCP